MLNRFILLLAPFVIIMLILTALSAIIKPSLDEYSQAEIDFAHEYAVELRERMERTATLAIGLENQSAYRVYDYFIDERDELSRFKHAALYLKGEMAEDFVYALSAAEEWAYYAAESALHPADEKAKNLAQLKYNKASAEFRALAVKQYKVRTQGLGLTNYTIFHSPTWSLVIPHRKLAKLFDVF